MKVQKSFQNEKFEKNFQRTGIKAEVCKMGDLVLITNGEYSWVLVETKLNKHLRRKKE